MCTYAHPSRFQCKRRDLCYSQVSLIKRAEQTRERLGAAASRPAPRCRMMRAGACWCVATRAHPERRQRDCLDDADAERAGYSRWTLNEAPPERLPR